MIVTAFVTAYVWLLAITTLPPLWIALMITPRGRRADALVRWYARLILPLAGCPVRSRGLERLNAATPAVLVANHSSYLDSLVLMAAIPVEYRFVINHRAATWPLIGLTVRKVGHIVVDRTRLASRHACAVDMRDTLRRGTSLIVFPEGTIGAPGRLLPFKPGAFHIAAEAGRPVVPVALRGTRSVVADGVGHIRPGPIDVSILEPLPTGPISRAEISRLRDRAQMAIAREVQATAP